jgi:hypothetical protein
MILLFKIITFDVIMLYMMVLCCLVILHVLHYLLIHGRIQVKKILYVCDDALTHESPTLFLNSPNHTIEDKYSYIEKYLHGLQFSYAYENPCCNHDANDDINSCNYFERGKDVNECHDNFNGPLYVSKPSKSHTLTD